MANSALDSTHRAARSFWRLMLGTSFVGIVCHLSFVVLFYLNGVTALALVNVGSVTLYATSAFLLSRGLAPWIAFFFVIFEVLAHAVLASYWVGWETGFYFYAILAIPVLIVADFQRLPSKILSVIGATVLVVGLDILVRSRAPVHVLPNHVVDGLHYFNLSAALSILIFMVANYFWLIKRAESELHLLATTDSLTHLLNRRSMVDAWRFEKERQESTGASLSLILCDIDHFKQINDTHGHDVGDRVLQAVSETLASNLRETDHLARWGGEEFIIMLVGAPLDTAVRIAEDLRAAVVETAIETDAVEGNKTLSVTATFGVSAMLPDLSESLEAAVARADAALYNGKRSGRNCVCRHDYEGLRDMVKDAFA
ncbi:diguanylate cyclase [Salinisphaera sp. C84B14]